MAKFSFKLQSVLRHRTAIEQEKQRLYAQALAAFKELEDQLKSLNQSMQTSNDDIRQNRLVGRLDIGFITAHRRFLMGMQRKAMELVAAMANGAWLYSAHKLDLEKIHQIKDLVFAPATQPTTAEAPSAQRDATTQPTLRLEEMMAKVSGRSASEQVEFMQTTFNAHMTLLDRRFQDLQNQRKTLDQVKSQIDKEREKLTAEQKALATAKEEQAKLLADKGFEDTLNL